VERSSSGAVAGSCSPGWSVTSSTAKPPTRRREPKHHPYATRGKFHDDGRRWILEPVSDGAGERAAEGSTIFPAQREAAATLLVVGGVTTAVRGPRPGDEVSDEARAIPFHSGVRREGCKVADVDYEVRCGGIEECGQDPSASEGHVREPDLCCDDRDVDTVGFQKGRGRR